MAFYQFSESASIQAPAAQVYAFIADYRDGHPRMLPRPYFVSLSVDQGGVGAGTAISFQIRLLGRTHTMRAMISEPEPGRALVETDMDTGSIVTTFLVVPKDGGEQAFVTITTRMRVPDGIFGALEGWLSERLLRPIYVKELAQLATVIAHQMAIAAC